MERSKILEKRSLNIWNQDEMDSYEKLNPQRHTKLKSFNDKEIKSITSHPLGDAHRGSLRWGPPISKKTVIYQQFHVILGSSLTIPIIPDLVRRLRVFFYFVFF